MIAAAVIALVVFVAAGALDFTLIRHQQAVTARRGYAAGSWAALACVIGAVGTLSVVDSAWYILPQALGFFAGNVVALRR